MTYIYSVLIASSLLDRKVAWGCNYLASDHLEALNMWLNDPKQDYSNALLEKEGLYVAGWYVCRWNDGWEAPKWFNLDRVEV